MIMVNNCGNCKHREVAGYEEPCSSCRTTSGGTPTKWEQQNATKTNADRVRAMSDEELCDFLYSYKFFEMCKEGCGECSYQGECVRRLMEWLKQPAEE